MSLIWNIPLKSKTSKFMLYSSLYFGHFLFQFFIMNISKMYPLLSIGNNTIYGLHTNDIVSSRNSRKFLRTTIDCNLKLKPHIELVCTMQSVLYWWNCFPMNHCCISIWYIANSWLELYCSQTFQMLV